VGVHTDITVEIDSEIPSSSDWLHRGAADSDRCGRNLVLTASR